jgi:hypothetical protein
MAPPVEKTSVQVSGPSNAELQHGGPGREILVRCILLRIIVHGVLERQSQVLSTDIIIDAEGGPLDLLVIDALELGILPFFVAAVDLEVGPPDLPGEEIAGFRVPSVLLSIEADAPRIGISALICPVKIFLGSIRGQEGKRAPWRCTAGSSVGH